MREWAADNFKSVQYPGVQEDGVVKKPFFKHQMPLWKRYLLLVYGVAGLLIGGLLFVAIVGFWVAVITS